MWLQQKKSVLRAALHAVLPVSKTHHRHILHFELQVPPTKVLSAKPPQRGNKDQEAKLFQKWLGKVDVRYNLVIYSDGSQIRYHDQGVTCTGWGYTIRKGGTTHEISQGKGRLRQADVVGAEVYGALMGLSAARAVGRHKRLFVCLDSTSVVDKLNETRLEASSNIFRCFKELAATHEPGVTVKWIPGHKDIKGNKVANRLAKDSAKMMLGTANPPTSMRDDSSTSKRRKNF
ncbi:hypothetical protein NPX13_g11040 [Xylaria arbuscula]|uniref:RNase H type-1 domain-containing protein n=1 Tax=Xylaria arbuscula TaxID=114810 RepID=A0A9W8N3I7_9PEZI|nr:hypothetical protein NPX13_g11040 [Xylaria arbuscula]